ncbi:MAG: hypothetical protein ACI977_000144 [Candidatus Nanohaloarchaea archaeon]|jgi:hypothetical protein
MEVSSRVKSKMSVGNRRTLTSSVVNKISGYEDRLGF